MGQLCDAVVTGTVVGLQWASGHCRIVDDHRGHLAVGQHHVVRLGRTKTDLGIGQTGHLRSGMGMLGV